MPSAEEILKQSQALNKAEKFKETLALLTDQLLEQYNDDRLYAELAQAAYRTKEYLLCRKAVDKALSINVNNPKANHYLGNLYADNKKYQKAIGAYQKAISIDPSYALPYYGLGNEYQNIKEYQKAHTAYRKAIGLDPTLAFAHYGLGNIYFDNHQYKNAIKAYQKAIAINPTFADLHYNIADAYYTIKDYEKAVKSYEGYLKLADEKDDYFISIAKDRITELKKLLKDPLLYKKIAELVNRIKDLLRFKGKCITHYTSLSAAKAMILDNSPFRLSEGAFLNDTSEGRELFNYLSFHITVKKDHDTVAEPFGQKPFIGSFVTDTKHDDLTLWRMYGKEAKEEARGCAITMHISTLQEKVKDTLLPSTSAGSSSKIDEDFIFYKVAYKNPNGDIILHNAEGADLENLNKLMKELKETISEFNNKKKKEENEKQDIIKLLNEISYLFKSSEYQYEEEVRLVVKGVGLKKEIDTDSPLPRVYIKLVPIRPLIHKITLGPKVERADEWAAAFYYSLDKEDLYPDIFISHLPFK